MYTKKAREANGFTSTIVSSCQRETMRNHRESFLGGKLVIRALCYLYTCRIYSCFARI